MGACERGVCRPGLRRVCVHSRRTPGGSEGLEEALFLLKSKRLSKKKRVRVEDGTIGTVNWLPPS